MRGRIEPKIKLDSVSRMFFDEIMDAMQNCEEIGGPEKQQYLDVMEAVSLEAKERKENYQKILSAEKPS